MVDITGEQKVWHKITLDFEAPETFSESPSTFRDYRLDVTFRNTVTGEVITLPGYFAADGDAANTNATSGNIWRVNFNPPSEGAWEYEASFRTGTDIAAKTYAEAPNAGSAVGYIDGASGTIDVAPTDKTGDDFRAKGMILQDEGTHYLQHQGDGDYFIRGGPGIPENFLANQDFDNTANGRHDYATHRDAYNAGDPTWDGGKGQAVIGAVNYLEEQGLNTIYLLTNTSGGDGQDVSPWTFRAQDTPKNDPGLTNGEIDKFSTYDVSKLSQWEIVFDHMDAKGIYKNVLLQETENDQQLDDGTNADGTSLSVERLVYIREMVARFGHNNGIQWNIGEENTNTDQQRADQAEYLKAVDGYDHLVVIHSYPGQINQVYDPLLDDEPFDGASFQTSAQNIRNEVIEYRDKSAASGDKWVLAWDEDSSSNGIVDPYSNNPDSANEKTLREGFWGMLTAGGSGGNWYFKGSSGHSLDQNYDTFDAHASVWKWTAAATSFFNTYIPFWDMRQADGLTSDNDDFVMAQDGEYYVVYAPYGEAGNIRLNLNGYAGETFDVFWYNPRIGGELIEDGQISGGGERVIGSAPYDNGKDWVLLVRNTNAAEFPSGGGQASPPTTPPDITPQPPVEDPVVPEEAYFEMTNGLVVMQAEDGAFVDASNPENDTWDLTQSFSGDKGDGVLLWTGNDYFGGQHAGTPKTAPLAYKFEVDEPGTYYLTIRAIRPVTGEESDRNNDFFVQFEDQGFTKIFFSGARDQFTFASTYDKNHQKSPATFDVTQDMIDQNNGVFTLTVSARSHMAGMDEIHIKKGSASRDHDSETSALVQGATDGGTPPPPPVENDAPVAVADEISTAHDTTILVDVLDNDTDSDGDALTLTSVSYSGNTALVSIENGQVKVNPLSAATSERVEEVTYTVQDANGATATGSLTVTVGAKDVTLPPVDDTPPPVDDTPPSPPVDDTPPPPAEPVNAAPVAVDDLASTAHDSTILIDVVANDTDADGDTLTLTSVSYDGDTALVSIENGQIKVNPLRKATEARVEEITYTITDANGASSSAKLLVDIAAEDDAATPVEPPAPPAPPAEPASDFVLDPGHSTPLSTAQYSPETGELTLVFDYVRLLDTTGPWANARHIDGLTIDGTAYEIEIHADDGPRDANGNFIFSRDTMENMFTLNIGEGLDPADGSLDFALTDRADGGGQLYSFSLLEDDGEVTPPATGGDSTPEAVDDAADTAQNVTILVDVLSNDDDGGAGPLTLVDVSYDGGTSLVAIKDGMIEVNPLKKFDNDRVEEIVYTVQNADGVQSTATLQVNIGDLDQSTVTPVEEVPEPPTVDPQPADPQDGLLDLFIADTTTNATLRTLESGDQVAAEELSDTITFYASSAEDDVFSHVELTFEGQTSREYFEPYALFGDINGDFRKGIDLDPGTYDLMVKGYHKNDDTVETLDLTFEIV
ncbi:MAG: cadherin-like domain-containing protein [Pseudomonadota bacterium]